MKLASERKIESSVTPKNVLSLYYGFIGLNTRDENSSLYDLNFIFFYTSTLYLCSKLQLNTSTYTSTYILQLYTCALNFLRCPPVEQHQSAARGSQVGQSVNGATVARACCLCWLTHKRCAHTTPLCGTLRTERRRWGAVGASRWCTCTHKGTCRHSQH